MYFFFISTPSDSTVHAIRIKIAITEEWSFHILFKQQHFCNRWEVLQDIFQSAAHQISQLITKHTHLSPICNLKWHLASDRSQEAALLPVSESFRNPVNSFNLKWHMWHS